MGVVTVRATLRASAPVNVVVTWTCGGAIGGYCAIGSRKAQMPPMSNISTAVTVAKIGRRMKKSTMTGRSLRGGGMDWRQGADELRLRRARRPPGGRFFASAWARRAGLHLLRERPGDRGRLGLHGDPRTDRLQPLDDHRDAG